MRPLTPRTRHPSGATTLVERLDHVLYPNVEAHWDDILFRERILRVIRPEMTVLDVGAGSGFVPQMNLRGLCRQVTGIDADSCVLNNPYLDEARIGTAESLPFDNGSFDLVVSDNVLEHLERPAAVFSEICRVLKPGGLFFAKTPNRHHYVATLATLTPHRFHRFFNALRGRPAADTYPTRYRANTAGTLRKLAAQAGFEVRSIDRIESRPEYLRISAATYLVGWLYERVVNSSSLLEPFRVLLIVEFRKGDK